MKVITIGRSSENDIPVNDPKVSRHHCQIIQHDDGHYTLADFGSTNGTYVNGRRIYGETMINPQDMIQIGSTTLPWQNYFQVTAATMATSQAAYQYSDNSVDYGHENSRDDSSRAEGFGVIVLLSGIASFGMVLYIFINYYTSFGGQLALQFGGTKSFFQLFAIYLRGYFGMGGQWFFMIAAIVLGGLSDLLDSVLDTKDSKLSSIGVWLGNAGLSIGGLFLLLALFAKQIAGL